MECPKCRAHNSDEADFCSLCFHPFKSKPAASPAQSPSLSFQSPRPAEDVTVSYYGAVNLTRGTYIIVQIAIFIFVAAVLIGAHSMTDADMAARLPTDFPPEMSGAKVRSLIKLWFWFGFVWECVATRYFLGRFDAKAESGN